VTRDSISRVCRHTVGVFAALAMVACTAQTLVTSRLDSGGPTVVTLDEAIILARPAPRLAAAARDYAYLGPVEINRMGHRDYYIWLALASTVDRAFAGISPADAEALAMVVDGHAMLLPLTDWTSDLDRSPYETAAPVYATLSARTSLHQIERIAGAGTIEVHIISKSGQDARYRKWQGTWSSWSLIGSAE